jgi:hypothetical protein
MGEHKHNLKNLVAPESVMISYVTNGNVKEKTMVSLVRTLAFDRAKLKLVVDIGSQTGLYIADNRDRTVENFLIHPKKPKWFMSIDTDIVWDPEQLYVLLEAAAQGDYPVLGGMYFTFIAEGTVHPVWKERVGEAFAPVTGTFAAGVSQVDVLGMGFTVIRRDVLEKMGEEYKHDRWRWFGHDPIHYEGRNQPMGEDVTFCERVRAIGFNTYGHAGVRVGHLKEILLDDKFFALLSQMSRGMSGSIVGSGSQVVEDVDVRVNHAGDSIT